MRPIPLDLGEKFTLNSVCFNENGLGRLAKLDGSRYDSVGAIPFHLGLLRLWLYGKVYGKSLQFTVVYGVAGAQCDRHGSSRG